MIRKLLLTLVWFPLVLTILVLNLSFLVLSQHSRTIAAPLSATPIDDSGLQIAASAGTGRVLGASVLAADARALLLGSFLERHGSPMAPYADLIVSESDEAGIDFRLMVAIAMCESGAGKRMPRRDSFNAWGIAVYTGQLTGASFRDWPHAIDWVTTYIKEKYYVN